MMTTYRQLHRVWTISPSDLTFLWEECQRCFYRKVVLNVRRPQSPMPSIFIKIDSAMKRALQQRPTAKIASGMPAGTIEPAATNDWVQSVPMVVPDSGARCIIRGRYDTIVDLDDGGYAVIDYKTAEPGSHLQLYARQLNAYAIALEHPALGANKRTPVSQLGLVVFTPGQFDRSELSWGILEGTLYWHAIQRDDAGFMLFMTQVFAILDLPEPPPPAPRCPFCSWSAT